MKQIRAFLFLITITSSLSAFAVSFEVIGPCSEKPVHEGTMNVASLDQSVGKTTKMIFDQSNIPYTGNETGFLSIINTPTGRESTEIISETKLRAYGWCYTVNGIGPDVVASEYFFKSNDDKLVWFYAYSTYDNGQWVDYCVPSYQIKAAQFCSK